MTVGGIHHQGIDLRLHQVRDPLVAVGTHTDRRAHQQAPVGILARIGKLCRFLDVLDGHQALQIEIIVDDQHLFDPVFVQQGLDLLPGGPFPHGDQFFFRGHDPANRFVVTGLETQIPAGDNTGQFVIFNHRHPGDAVPPGQVQHFADRGVGGHGYRIVDNPAFELLDLRWMTPKPPAWARQIAVSASVTVSMAAETSGIFRVRSRLSWVLRETSRGSTDEAAGTSRTSSKVRASRIFCIAGLYGYVAAIPGPARPALSGAYSPTHIRF